MFIEGLRCPAPLPTAPARHRVGFLLAHTLAHTLCFLAQVLEDRVDVLGCEAQQGAQRLVRLEGQVQESSKRLARLEDAAEAGQAAASLARASSSGTAGDALAALQGHLLAQQQKLQAHADSLAAGIRQGLAGQVGAGLGSGLVGRAGEWRRPL